MLTKLHIKNYAIIEDLDVDFLTGLTTITGAVSYTTSPSPRDGLLSRMPSSA